MSRQDYYKKMESYAISAGNQLHIDWKIILAWWTWETQGGTNLGSRKYNNHAGIKYSKYGFGYQPSNSIHAGFKTLELFVKDFVRVLNLSYYKNIPKGAGVEETTRALNASPYAVADYNIDTIKQYVREIESMPFGNDHQNNESSQINFDKKIDQMSDKDLKKYALIGLVGATFINLIND